MDVRSDRGRLVAGATAALLVVAVAVVYASIRQAGFFYLDDALYIADNPAVRDGLTLDGLRQAFFARRGALWMPLTFTSHMIDVSLFGLSPTGPHLLNVALHAVNAVLVLLLLLRTTGALLPSAAVAALFALHPLRVESVAWIAERKDVLSATFALMALHAWVGYARAPSPRAYRRAAAAVVCALLTKPMMVTLPILLLFFDCWPLRRLGTLDVHGRPITPTSLVAEKGPLLLAACVTAAITVVGAGADGAFAMHAEHPLPERLAHAAVAYVWYAWKTVWPTDLAIFYPFAAAPVPHVVGAALVLVAVAALAAAAWRRAPWIAVGGAWFVLGLLPVIGLTQAGGQGMADRFTYLPSLGLLVAVVWTADALARSRPRRALLAGATIVASLALAVASVRQVALWRDSATLFEHTLAVTHDNWIVEQALGSVLVNADRPAEAYGHFEAALRLSPKSGMAAYGMGLALEKQGRPDDAVPHYREALELDPSNWRAHNNLGVWLVHHGDVAGALHHFGEAVRLNPSAADVNGNLRDALRLVGIESDGYVRGLLTWANAVSADDASTDGADYGAVVAHDLLASSPEALHRCVGEASDAGTAPFDVYVQVDATGALTALTAVPPTDVARCVRDELRAARVPAPPFAPFHAKVSMLRG